jgi:hypothetical protein
MEKNRKTGNVVRSDLANPASEKPLAVVVV